MSIPRHCKRLFSTRTPAKTVGIIGGGVSGILALRNILRNNDPHIHPVLYESSSELGGLWIYDGKGNKFGKNNYRTAANSIYRNLVTNQSKQVMQFRDMEHVDPALPTFLHHRQVLDYLRRYCQEFHLEDYVLKNCEVQLVTPLISNDYNKCKWEVVFVNKERRETRRRVFDHIVVCNGHYTKPYLPVTPGFEDFKGKWLHSRYYRCPEEFSDKDVIVIGANASGVDIALDVAHASKQTVYLSNRGDPLKSPLPANVIEVPEVSHFNEDGSTLTFVTGEELSVKSVIFTTGYTYDFPFLNKECGIQIHKNRIINLYKHIVNINHSSMLFVGVPSWMPVFQILYLQAIYISKIISGELELPTKTEMLEAEEKDFKLRLEKGWHPSKAHTMTGFALAYGDELADATNVDKIPDSVKNIYNHVLERRATDCMNYKNDNYALEDFK